MLLAPFFISLLFLSPQASWSTPIQLTVINQLSLDDSPVSPDLTVTPNHDQAQPDVNNLQKYRSKPRKNTGLKKHVESISDGSIKGAVRIFNNGNNFRDGDHSQVLYLGRDQCMDLPWTLDSIDTLGLCVLLWDDEGCNGNHKVIHGDREPSVNKTPPNSRSIELC